MKTKILVVDDDITVMNVISDVRAAAGLEAIQCNSGFEAIKKLKNNPLDLIITDLKMPDMDGFEFSKVARQISDAPIMMLSGLWRHAQDPDKLNLVDEYVEKPVPIQEFISQVNEMLDVERDSGKVIPIRDGIELK